MCLVVSTIRSFDCIIGHNGAESELVVAQGSMGQVQQRLRRRWVEIDDQALLLMLSRVRRLVVVQVLVMAVEMLALLMGDGGDAAVLCA